MSEVPSIGAIVRQWRKFHKLNVTEFAKQAGLTKGYVSELENNKIDNPTPPNLEKLANAIGISVLDLLARRMPGEVSEQDQAGLNQPIPTSPAETGRRPKAPPAPLSLAQPALPISPALKSRSQQQSVGQRIERLIEDANLSEQEEATVAQALEEMTRILLVALKRRSGSSGS